MTMKNINEHLSVFLSNAVSWSARFLAIAAVLVLGKSNQALAAEANLDDGNSYAVKDQAADDQMSYVQVGDVDEYDGTPPNPE